METLNNISGIVSRDVSAATVLEGTVCVVDAATGALKPYAASGNEGAQLFVTLIDPPAKEQLLVSAAVAGNQPGDVSVIAAAGAYTAGAPVYVSDGGKAAATGTGLRVLGTCAESVTLSAEGKVRVFLQHVPLAPAGD